MGMSSILPKKLAIGAIGIYSGADLTTFAVLRVNVFLIRLRLNRCMLRRYRSFKILIAFEEQFQSR